MPLPLSSLRGRGSSAADPRLPLRVHGLLEPAQLRGRPGMVSHHRPLDGAAEVFLGTAFFFYGVFFYEREREEASKEREKKKNKLPEKKGKTPSLFLSLTLNPSVKTRCASLNSGVEKESLGSSSRRRASSCREERRRRKREEGEREEETRKRGGFSQSSCGDAARKKGGKENAL